MVNSSRRQFLLTASMATTGALLAAPLRAAETRSEAVDGSAVFARRLDSGWQFRQGPTDGIWEIWRAEEDNLWQPVSLPHCFNGSDACDPDEPYFRGHGWYRTRLAPTNPFPNGRTLLHFQGAGQTTTVWVGSTLAGTHKGGYDEFAFDITEMVQRLSSTVTGGGVPIAVMCDNSPDLDRIPSDLSDFCLYGGLYRHVNLVYLPAVALDAIHILPTVESDGSSHVSISARLYNPVSHDLPCDFSVQISDPSGRLIHQSTRALSVWNGLAQIAEFNVASPELWSPESPRLYSCSVTLSGPAGKTRVDERFGIRHVEFVEHGPFKLNGKRVLLSGTQRHTDHVHVAAAMSDDLVRQEMRLIREMGANFIALATTSRTGWSSIFAMSLA